MESRLPPLHFDSSSVNALRAKARRKLPRAYRSRDVSPRRRELLERDRDQPTALEAAPIGAGDRATRDEARRTGAGNHQTRVADRLSAADARRKSGAGPPIASDDHSIQGEVRRVAAGRRAVA